MSVPSRKQVKSLEERAKKKTKQALDTERAYGLGIADNAHRLAARAWADVAWAGAVRMMFYGKILVAIAVIALLLLILL